MSATRACYFPDGSNAADGNGPSFVPCNPTAEQSACCTSKDACLSTGLCFSNFQGNIYRGACTDSTFNSSACPQTCRDVQPNWFTTVAPCAINATTEYFNFTCVANITAPFCDGATSFSLNIGDITNSSLSPSSSAPGTSSTPVLNSILTSSPQTATLTAYKTIGPTSTASCAGKDSTAIAVGAGVGVPLFVLALLGFGTALWYRRKWKNSNPRQPQWFPVAAVAEMDAAGPPQQFQHSHNSYGG